MAWIPEEKGSWALPLRHERITSFETPITKAAFQLKQVCQHLPERPISLWDSEYGCAKFVKLTANINTDVLMRLRPNRCVFGAPGPYPGKGRPAKHGHKMKLSDSTTWGLPVESMEIDDPTWGRVEITTPFPRVINVAFSKYISASQKMVTMPIDWHLSPSN